MGNNKDSSSRGVNHDEWSRMGVLYYGTTALPMPEALDLLGRGWDNP